MKVKLIKADFNVRPFLSEILIPDKRFTVGYRRLGKFESKANTEVTLTLEWVPRIRIGELLITIELGIFRVIAINGLTSTMECKSVKINNIEGNSFSISSELDIEVGASVMGESSRG